MSESPKQTVIGEVEVDLNGTSYVVPYQAKVDEDGDVADMNYDLPTNLLEALAMPVTEQIQVKIMEDMQKWKRRY